MVISDVEFETKEHEISTMDRIGPQQSNTFVHTAGTCIPLCTNLYVVVQFFPWFKLSFPCFKLIIHYHSLKNIDLNLLLSYQFSSIAFSMMHFVPLLKFCIKYCFQFPLWLMISPKDIENNIYGKCCCKEYCEITNLHPFVLFLDLWWMTFKSSSRGRM